MEPFCDWMKWKQDFEGEVLKCTKNKAFNRNAPLNCWLSSKTQDSTVPNVEQSDLLFYLLLQVNPCQLLVHVHVKELPSTWHLPLYSHGLDTHSSTSEGDQKRSKAWSVKPIISPETQACHDFRRSKFLPYVSFSLQQEGRKNNFFRNM